MTKFRSLLPLYAVICLGFLGYALTITIFIPMLMNNDFTILATNTSISTRAMLSGMLLAMYPLGQFFDSPVIGNLSDRFGRKKVLVLSLLGSSIGFMCITASIQFQHLNLLFISSFLTGLCESNMAISQSVIADKFPDPAQKTKFIGYAYSACSLGYIIGPLLGVVCGGTFGYSGAFGITALGVLCLTIWTLYSFEDEYIPNSLTTTTILETITALRSILHRPNLYKIYFINFLIFFSVQGLYRVVPLYIVDKWHPSLSLYSLIISYVSLICFLANLFILGKLAKWFSNQKLLSLLLILGGLSILLIPLPHTINWIWITFGISIVPTIMALPTCTIWLSSHAIPSEQGQVLGNNQALLVLGEAASAAVGGLIAAIMIPLPIFVMGIIFLITGIAVIKDHRNNKVMM